MMGTKLWSLIKSLLGYWGDQKILRKETFILESSVGNHSLAAFSLRFLINIPWHSVSAILSPGPSLLFPLMCLPLSGFAPSVIVWAWVQGTAGLPQPHGRVWNCSSILWREKVQSKDSRGQLMPSELVGICL